MPASKKIIVSVPEALLLEMDQMGILESKNRSEIIREAIKFYLSEKRRKELREQLRKGYIEMGEINRAIAEEGFNIENEALQSCIQKLSE